MTKNRKKISEEQLITAKNIVEQEGLDAIDLSSVFTLYQSVVQAKARAGKKDGYWNVKFLLGETPKDAVINIIKNNEAFWYMWKYLQNEYELKNNDKDYRASIHRIDSKGHYELSNIAAIPMSKHLQEHAKPANLFAIDSKGGLRLGFYPSQKQAQQKLKVGGKRLNKMQKGDYDYTQLDAKGTEETLSFLRLEPTNEPVPTRKKEEQDAQDKQSYLHTLNKIDQLKEWQIRDYAEHRVKTIAGLEQRIRIYEANGFHLL